MKQVLECDLVTNDTDCPYCCARCAIAACPFRCSREDAEHCEHRQEDARRRNFLRLVA